MAAVTASGAESVVEKMLSERIPEMDRLAREGLVPSTPVPKDWNRWWLGAVERKQRQVRAAQGRTVDLVMIGDSITYNWEEKDFGAEVWPLLKCKFIYYNC